MTTLYALNASTGAKLWSYADRRAYAIPRLPWRMGWSISARDDGNVYALNASTGAKLWSYTTGDRQCDSSPAVANGVVYVGSLDGNVYALNASTGAKLWSYATGRGSDVDSSPAVANGVVYVRRLPMTGQRVCAERQHRRQAVELCRPSFMWIPRPRWRMGWFMSVCSSTATCMR